jgi:alkanesulfonate monooxygenase SsuD/methylene tetrahydromethanopterin reductase-like flavin-dependent oxidoreductase (luciferase family)
VCSSSHNQGASYDDQLRVAKATEDLASMRFFRSDHLHAMGTTVFPGPTEVVVGAAGLARETSRIRLGTMVTSSTFRHPSAGDHLSRRSTR